MNEFSDWENKMGFTSYATWSQIIYEKANPELFNSQEEALAYAQQNNQSIQLIEEDGEYILEPRLYGKSERFLLNKDAMVQIGDQVIKLFKQGTISGPVDQYNEIAKIAEFDSAVNNALKKEVNIRRKDLFQKDFVDRKDDGRDRIYLGVECSDPTLLGVFDRKVEYTIRPYRKTLGIWYHCSKVIEGNIHTNVSYLDNNGNEQSSIYYGESIPLGERRVASNQWKIPNVKKFRGFTHIDCWAKSTSVPGQICTIYYSDNW